MQGENSFSYELLKKKLIFTEIFKDNIILRISFQ